jgi:hypothetical protein
MRLEQLQISRSLRARAKRTINRNVVIPYTPPLPRREVRFVMNAMGRGGDPLVDFRRSMALMARLSRRTLGGQTTIRSLSWENGH